jgi:hypothetical protein
MMSDDELKRIKTENEQRKEYRRDMAPGKWDYDSMGFIDNGHRPRQTRTAVLVRTRDWFDRIAMGEGIVDFSKTATLQIMGAGQYIAEVCSTTPETDIELLLAEVRRLRAAKT